MDYLHAAFGPFEPQRDRDAAMKFALNVLLMDDRLDDLAALVAPGHHTSGVGGEPGWEIDRVESCGAEGIGFRAQVDPQSYALAHPEGVYDRAAFWALLRPMLQAYAKHQPEAVSAVDRIVGFAPAS
jgi:hypothetical protein